MTSITLACEAEMNLLPTPEYIVRLRLGPHGYYYVTVTNFCEAEIKLFFN